MAYSHTIANYISDNFKSEEIIGRYPYDGITRGVCDKRPDGDQLPCPNAKKPKDCDVCRKCDVRLGLPSTLTQAEINEMCAKAEYTNKVPNSGRRPYYSPNKGKFNKEVRHEPCKCKMSWCPEMVTIGEYCKLCYGLIWRRKTLGVTGDALYEKPKRRYKIRKMANTVDET